MSVTINTTMIALGLAKYGAQVHGDDEHGKVVLRQQVARSSLAAFFANLPPCLVGRSSLSAARQSQIAGA
ncbi:hypothetical protein QU487_18135 [Crenobacter sp. SG2305]|uniref:hypothetical protein n=1 Tax=Crenobacter oryzisoli TaxID=3056844 RepID=UPI0025AAFE47|nr:hypothetical protein [Crenobacter sp. SG2305]MDN0084657.1 hypothetical protein [Crenobacter sp. SG2305]